jgi:hypothetical protein
MAQTIDETVIAERVENKQASESLNLVKLILRTFHNPEVPCPNANPSLFIRLACLGLTNVAKEAMSKSRDAEFEISDLIQQFVLSGGWRRPAFGICGMATSFARFSKP